MALSKASQRDFSGNVILITGSSSGIGAEIAVLFASYGAQVVINGLSEGDVVEVSHRVDAESNRFWSGKLQKPLQALQMVGDITDSTFARRLVAETVKRFGKLNIVVNSAGAGCMAMISDHKIVDHFDHIMKLNVRSIVELTHLAVPYLEKTRGCIINIGTILSAKPTTNNSMYCVSKAALDMFTKCCALELASKRIRVNSINPGPVRTSFLQSLGASRDDVEHLYEQLSKKEPLGRIGETMDVATAAAFLASEEASFITGCLLTVDGGMSFA